MCDVKKINDRVMLVKLVAQDLVFNVIDQSCMDRTEWM